MSGELEGYSKIVCWKIFLHWHFYVLCTITLKSSHVYLLTIYRSIIRPTIECRFHVWGVTPKSIINQLDANQKLAIHPIDKLDLIDNLPPLSHMHHVEGPCRFYHYCKANCSLEITFHVTLLTNLGHPAHSSAIHPFTFKIRTKRINHIPQTSIARKFMHCNFLK